MDKLTTKRLIIRPIVISDVNQLYRYAKKPHIGPKAGWSPHRDKYETYQIVNIMIKEKETWAICLKENNLLIGTISLNVKEGIKKQKNVRELGYALNDDFWNQGIVSEAVKEIIKYGFTKLKLKKIICGHYEINYPSKKIIEKNGFTYTHTEERKDHNNNLKEVIMYELTNEKYKEFVENEFSNKI